MYELQANALKVLAAVYQRGGVRPAARALCVSHSAVSRQLSELEKWIGVALLERGEGIRKLTFTPQGDALGRAAADCFEKLASAVVAVREKPRRNAVKLTTTPSMASLWLLPRLTRFQQGYPGLELSVIVEQRLVDPDQQDADLAIRMGRGPWPGLECRPLMDDDLYPVMSREYWERTGRPASPDDLQHLQLIHDRDPNTPWESWIEQYCSVHVDSTSGPRFTSSDLVLRAAAQGLGVALARGRLAEEAIAIGSLVKPFGGKSVHLHNAYWIVQPLKPERAAVRSVRAWLESEARVIVS